MIANTEATVASAVQAVEALAHLARQAAPAWIPSFARASDDDEPEPNPPSDERAVLVFINGHVALDDAAGREGGGWGVRTGFYDHGGRRWRAGGVGYDGYVTHWMELPAAPALATWPPVRG